MKQKLEEKKQMTIEKIDSYCKWMLEMEKSSATVEKYRYYLLLFLEYVSGKEVEKGIVIKWKFRIKEEMAPVTVNVALSALNGFFNYCGWPECETQFLKIGRKIYCQESRELSKGEYKRLVETAFNKGNERLGLILQTICSSGIRISELAFITVEAVEKGTAHVDCKGKIRTVLLPGKLCSLLKDYAGRRGIKKGKIFITKSGNSMDRSNVWREMKALGEDANVGSEKIFPHNLRHLFARTYYKKEKDLSKLADILGHCDVNTTRIYTIESGKRHRKQLENLQLLIGSYNRITLLL